jgi:O-succinylhomoserine sulfhydrylase
VPGNIYSRFTNPTVRAFEERLAALEGGEACVATASGMAAILPSAWACSGPAITSSPPAACSAPPRCCSTSTWPASGSRPATWPWPTRRLGRGHPPNTRLLFLETPSNPLTEMGDIRALADLAHAHGCLLAVDNCFCTPALQRPLALGADLVIHSATKYLDGQGRCVGGAVVGDRKLGARRSSA